MSTKSPSYEDLILPPLPEPWTWRKGEDDGDPQAVLEQHGWRVTVYEAVACRYTEHLAVVNRRVHDDARDYPPHGIPFTVFNLVHEALKQWYGVKP